MHSLILFAIVLCTISTITAQESEDANSDNLDGIVRQAVPMINTKYSQDLQYVAIRDVEESVSDIKIYNLQVLLSTWTGAVLEYSVVVKKYSAKGPIDITFTRGNEMFTISDYFFDE